MTNCTRLPNTGTSVKLCAIAGIQLTARESTTRDRSVKEVMALGMFRPFLRGMLTGEEAAGLSPANNTALN